MKKTKNLIEYFDVLHKKKRNRIAIGLLNDYPLTVESLRKVKNEIDLILVGPKKITGFNCIKSSDAKTIVELARDKKVDAIFRGNFDAVAIYDAIHDVLGYNGPVFTIAPVFIKKINSINENFNGLISFLPVSPSNDVNLASKMKNIDVNIEFFESFGVKPRIGVLSAGKPTDILEGLAHVDKSLTEAEFLVNWYTKKGYQTKHFNHQVEYAVQDSDIVVYQNGIAGFQGVRAIMFFGHAYLLCGISPNLPIVYGQTAEAFRDWEKNLRFLNGYLNRNL